MNYIGQLQYNVNIGNKQIKNFDLLAKDENNKAKNLLEFMKTEAKFPDEQSGYISKLGIQAPPGTQWEFQEEGDNTKSVYIGATGIYELDNVKLLGLFYIPQSNIQTDLTAQYIAYDNSIIDLQKAESGRQKEIENITEINEDSVQKYINAQKGFYIDFLNANQYYDKAFKGLYWNAGILNPENIIIDYYLELEDN